MYSKLNIILLKNRHYQNGDFCTLNIKNKNYKYILVD